MKIGLIVEGHGEVQAAPVLVRRIAAHLGMACEVPPPLRTPRSKLVQSGELERAVTLMGGKVRGEGGVLVLLDADDDLACELAPALLTRARTARPDVPVSVVLAVREYEAWLVAAAASLAGRRDLPADLTPPDDPEAIRDAKGWLDHHMPRGYSPTIDQSAFSALIDLELARRARSFDKLMREVASLLQAAT